MYIYIYKFTYIFTGRNAPYMYICIYVYKSIYMHIYMYIYICTWLAPVGMPQLSKRGDLAACCSIRVYIKGHFYRSLLQKRPIF